MQRQLRKCLSSRNLFFNKLVLFVQSSAVVERKRLLLCTETNLCKHLQVYIRSLLMNNYDAIALSLIPHTSHICSYLQRLNLPCVHMQSSNAYCFLMHLSVASLSFTSLDLCFIDFLISFQCDVSCFNESAICNMPSVWRQSCNKSFS